MKLITFAVPCYNSAAYMDKCIESLLPAGDQAEIILIDDGSTKDDTPAICDRYAEQYPDIIRVIHQPNGGHGEGVNQGLRHARGMYYKVVDSDDWLDTDALAKVLERLREQAEMPEPLEELPESTLGSYLSKKGLKESVIKVTPISSNASTPS